MPPSTTLLTTTVQSSILNAISNIVAQIIDQYKKDKPFSLNIIALLQFVTYGVIVVPINHYWQRWLEITFPGFLFQSKAETGATATANGGITLHTRSASTLPVSSSSSSSSQGVVEVKGKLVPKKTSMSGRQRRVFNFAMKFLLDQSIGGILNIFLFLALINLLKGASWERTWELVLEDFKPIMYARLKYRPVVSTLMYTVVPLDRRVVFGSASGVIWGVYLSLFGAV